MSVGGTREAAQESVDEFRRRAREWLATNVPTRESAAAARPRGAHGGRLFGGQRELQKAAFDAGFAGITLPAEYGGQGLTPAHEAAFGEESSRYVMIPPMNMACAGPMLTHASPDFLQRHIPKMLAGDEVWVQFFSEPGAGSDLAGVRTRADRDGDRSPRAPRRTASSRRVCSTRSAPGSGSRSGVQARSCGSRATSTR
jgi:alkylation response protein AidB-like acyl-CoA dehydrogenase